MNMAWRRDGKRKEMEGIFKDFFERETVASIVTEYDRDPGSNYIDGQLKQRVKSQSKQVKRVLVHKCM